MKKVYKTEKNLQKVWNDLDKAYEHMYQALEDLSLMVNLPDELKKDVEQFDISAISCLKEKVEEVLSILSKLKGEI